MTLKLVIYLDHVRFGWLDALSAYDVTVVHRHTAVADGQLWNERETIHAVLVEAKFLASTIRNTFINHCHQMGTAVAMLTELNGTRPLELLRQGVDIVVPTSAGPAEVACAIWSAHHQSLARRELSRELELLRTATSERSLIERAKQIIAEQSNISEANAMRARRRAARDRRRMPEVAQTIIEAHEIMARNTRQLNIGESSDVP